MAVRDLQSISRTPPTVPTLDYSGLLREGIARAQNLSGDLWTDFNEHDPGVTILQGLCFALTDLGYRTAHPIEDLLASSSAARSVPIDRQPLFTGNEVLGCAALTADDYRKLIYDRIEGVKNAWLEPVDDDKRVCGLHRVLIQTFPPVSGRESHVDDRDVVANTQRLLRSRRNLGEDFESVTLLRRRELTLDAEIEIDPEANPEEVVADLMFSVDMGLNPPPRVQALDTALQHGEPPDRLFEGPKLDLGIISQASLLPLRTDAPFERVLEIMLSVDGVLQVDRLQIAPTDPSDDPARPDPMAVPTLSRDTEAIVNIRVRRGGVRIKVEPARVLSGLRHREQRRRWDVAYAMRRMEDDVYGRVPKGNARRNLARYRSIQHLFPAIYGIGPFGAGGAVTVPQDDPHDAKKRHPGDATERLEDSVKAKRFREAQARQLKAYLLFFEQPMADYLAQLENLARLFSFEPLERTYACQALADPCDIDNDDPPPNVAPVLGGPIQRQRANPPDGEAPAWFERHKAGLEAVTGAHDPHLDRHERALNHFLARFNERFDDDRLQRLSGVEPFRRDEFREQRAGWKRAFLEDYIRLGRDRGLGLDLSSGPDHEPPVENALQKRVRLLCGLRQPFHLVEHILLRDMSALKGIGAMEIGADFRITAREPVRAVRIGAHGDPLVGVIDRKDPAEMGWLALLELLVERGSDEANYTIYPPGAYRSFVRLDGGSDMPSVEILVSFPSVDEALLAIRRTAALLRQAKDGQLPRHQLVRPALLPPDLLAHRVSAFLPSGADSSRTRRDFEDFVELTLRRNVPAHLTLSCFWLDSRDMAAFSEHYDGWCKAQRAVRAMSWSDPERKAEAAQRSFVLRSWIHRHHCARTLRERATLRGVVPATEDR